MKIRGRIMSSLYKRKDSPYYWWETIYKGRKLQRSTKQRRKDKARGLIADWDLKIMKDDTSFIPSINKSNVGVSGFISDYLKFIEKRKSENTLNITKSVLKKFESFLITRNIDQLDEINVKIIDEYVDWLENSPKTKKNYHNIVSLMLKQAVKEDVINSNPADLATLPKIILNSEQNRTLETVDLEIIFGTAGQWFDYYQFLLHTGLRAGDVAMLTNGDIDRQKKAITCLIRKSDRIHEIPLANHLIQGLPFGKDEDPIFPQLYSVNKKKVSNKMAAPRKHMQSMLKINGRPKATLHSFRRTFNNLLRDEGLAIGDRRILMAHSSCDTTKIYTNPNFELARKYVNLIPVYGKSDIEKRSN